MSFPLRRHLKYMKRPKVIRVVGIATAKVVRTVLLILPACKYRDQILQNHKPTPVHWIKKFFYCRKNGKIGYVSHFFRQGTLGPRFYLKIQDRDFVKNGSRHLLVHTICKKPYLFGYCHYQSVVQAQKQQV